LILVDFELNKSELNNKFETKYQGLITILV